MSKKQNLRKLAYLLLTLFLLVLMIISGRGFSPAFADTSEYSSVIDDLMKDKSFNFGDYSESENDYSIQVIQIAESENGEFFIYTYQPCQNVIKLITNEINLSFSDKVGGEVGLGNTSVKTNLYKLRQLSTWGVFAKYLVEGVTVGKDDVRYYNITSLYRDYNKLADDSSLKNEHSIAVNIGQCWKAETVNGVVQYEVKKVDTITITNCLYGTVRVPEGFNFAFSYSCDMHIIAFNTDIKMDNLLEADVAFKYSYIEEGIYGQDTGFKWQDKTVTVNYKEKGSSEDHIFGKGSKTWDKIQIGADFVETCSNFKIKMSDEMKSDLWNKDWVLAFWETDYENIAGGVFGWLNYIGAVFGGTIYRSTIITDATVIRLEFLKDGKAYNLGAVSNKSTDFEVIGGEDETFIGAVKDKIGNFFDNIWDKIKGFFGSLSWWQWLLIGLGILLCLGLIFSAVKYGIKIVFEFIGLLIKKILQGVLWLFCLPFKGIKKLFGKLRGD